MNPTDEELADVVDILLAFDREVIGPAEVFARIAPLVLERAAKALEEENDDGGCYLANRLRELAKP